MFQKGYQENKMTREGVMRKIKKYSDCFISKKYNYGGF